MNMLLPHGNVHGFYGRQSVSFIEDKQDAVQSWTTMVRRVGVLIIAMLSLMVTSLRAASAESPVIDIYVFHDVITASQIGGHILRASVSGMTDTLAEGSAGVSANGTARVDLRIVSSDRQYLLAPGNHIHLYIDDKPLADIKIPMISARIQENRLVGSGPVGHSMEVWSLSQTGNEAGHQADIMVDSGGAFSLDLGPYPELLERGEVIYPDAIARSHFVYRKFRAELLLSSAHIQGAASDGTIVTGDVISPGGARIDLGHTTAGDQVGTNPDIVWLLAAPRSAAFQIGATTAISYSSSPDVSPVVISGVIPDLYGQINSEKTILFGHGPRDSRVDARIYIKNYPPITQEIVTDSRGVYSVSLPANFESAMQWQIDLIYQEGDAGIRFIRRLVNIGLNISLYGSRVTGRVADYGTETSILLQDAHGKDKTSGRVRTVDDGTFVWTMTNPSYSQKADFAVIEPGDTIVIGSSTGDSRSVHIPYISSYVERETSTLRIIARPFDKATITIHRGKDTERESVACDATGIGYYVLGDPSDIAGVYGMISINDPTGDNYSIGWAVPSLDILLSEGVTGSDGAAIRGKRTAGLPVTVAVTNSSGKALARQSRAGRSAGRDADALDPWIIDPVLDLAGFPLHLESGDRIMADVGVGRATLTIPQLTASVDDGGAVIRGDTEPNTSVLLAYGRSNSALRTGSVTSGADGHFVFSIESGGALLPNDLLWVQLNRRFGDVIRREVPVPGFDVDLDAGTVESWIEPDTDASMIVRRNTRILCSKMVRSDNVGHVRVDPCSGSADMSRIRSGDRMALTTHGEMPRSIDMVIPSLIVSIDLNAGKTRVMSSVGGDLLLSPRRAFDGENLMLPTQNMNLEANTTSELQFSAGNEVPPVGAPGYGYRATLRTVTGHRISLTRFIPVMSVGMDGAMLCGVAAPGDVVNVNVSSGHTGERYSGSAKVQSDSWFYILLHGNDGQHPIIETGDTVSGKLTPDSSFSLVIPFLEFGVDQMVEHMGGTATDVVRGTGTPYVMHYVSSSSIPCGDASYVSVASRQIRADSAGRFSLAVGAPGIGERIEVATLSPEGQRVYRSWEAARLRIILDSNIVEVRRTAYLPGTATLRVGDVEVGRGLTNIDALGGITVNLLSTNGTPAHIKPGQTVSYSDSQGEVTLNIEMISVDFSTARGIDVVSDPGRDIRIDLLLNDGREAHLFYTIPVGGRLNIGADDLPVRGGWGLHSIQRIDAVLTMPGGHEVIARVDVASERPTAPGTRRLFIPIASNMRARH